MSKQTIKDLLDIQASWNDVETPGKNASGVRRGAGRSNSGSLQARRSSGATPFGLKEGRYKGVYGQDIPDAKPDYAASWGMAAKDAARGYEGGVPTDAAQAQQYGSFPQTLPDNDWTDWDRSAEFKKLEEGYHSGADGARKSPGTQLVGSGDPFASNGPKSY